MYKLTSIYLVLTLAACGGMTASSYESYDCRQIGQERLALSDELARAAQTESAGQVYELAQAAFAVSRGESYTAHNDMGQSERIKNQMESLRHAAIRRGCGW